MMISGTDTVKLVLKNSGRELNVSVDSLTDKSREFLEHFATFDLAGQEFVRITGKGSGAERFKRLLEACGYRDNPPGFFSALVPLFAGSKPEDRKVNGIVLPYLYLLALLEVCIPQHGYVSVKDVDSLVELTNLEVPEDQRGDLQKVIDMYPVRLSYHTVRQMMLSPDVAYQYMPFVEELDPAGHANTWIGQFHQGLLEQMYRNRVIYLLNMSCPVYCRFCFRKHKESRNEDNPTVEDVAQAIEHVRNSPDIKEIVITGGDPFLNRRNMEATIDGLMGIDQVQTLRLATRSVAYYPDLFLRKEESYLKFLKHKNNELQLHGKRMEIATHFIHPDEVSPVSLEIITELVKSGIAVYIQTPFLQDCNDQGPELKKLFKLLRGAGAEMHYIYIPCSPIHGNSVYWSTLSDGIDIAEYLRAHLSDRSVPKICTATPIGKMEWYTSGWAVEPVEGENNSIWIRTPYTPSYFKSFAPLATELPNIRVNPEGTLDIQYMAKIGKEAYFLGSRPLRIQHVPVPLEVPENLTGPGISTLLKAESIVSIGTRGLSRVHETRVEIDLSAGPEVFEYIRANTAITDVVVRSEGGFAESLHRLGKIAGELREIEHVNAMRIRSCEFTYSPEVFTRPLIAALAEMNHLSVSNPLRMEIETWFINAGQVRDEHARLTRRLTNRGITVYANTPLLGGINDFPDELCSLTFAYRKAGIEFHHLYVAGHPVQREWNLEHPVDMYDVIDIASKIRREGSGREGPRYIIQTPLGEVYYGLTSSFIHGKDGIRVKLDSYSLPYFKEMDPDYTLPENVQIGEDGKPVIPVSGLVSSTEFPI
jgi:lysine 2,3-aminomutase